MIENKLFIIPNNDLRRALFVTTSDTRENANRFE